MSARSRLEEQRRRLEEQQQRARSADDSRRQAEFERTKRKLEDGIREFRSCTAIAYENFKTLDRLRLTGDMQAILRMHYEKASKEEMTFPGFFTSHWRTSDRGDVISVHTSKYKAQDSGRIVCLATKDRALVNPSQPFLRVITREFSGYFYKTEKGGFFEPDEWVLSTEQPTCPRCTGSPFRGKIPLSLPSLEIHMVKDAIVAIRAYRGHATWPGQVDQEYVAVSFCELNEEMFNPHHNGELLKNAWLAEIPVFSTRQFSEDEFVDMILRYNPRIRT